MFSHKPLSVLLRVQKATTSNHTCRGSPLAVSKIRISVPVSEAVANRVPVQ
jgi:hypothetical protein